MSADPRDEVQFADGFDVPDRLAFGLAAAELLVVVAAALAAYAILHIPAPRALAVTLALLVACAGAALGWLRVSGRPLVQWVRLAVLFGLRPRRGRIRLELPQPAPGPVMAFRPTVLRDAPGDAVQPRAARRRDGGAHRVTFFSLKGGTGRTTLAVELAARLAAERGRRATPVALLDLDLRSASVGARLGLHGSSVVEFAAAPPEERRAAELLCRHPSGMQVLIGPQHPPNPEWPVTPAVVRELLRDLDMAGFGLVVIDLPPELTPHTESVLRSVDDVLIVVSPTVTGVHDAYRTTEALRRRGLRHQLRYVVNRQRPAADVSEAMRDLDGQVVAEIPDDTAVLDAEDRHQLAGDGRGPAANALRRFARRISGEISWSWEE
ncbi:MAG: P-loop NTPase [Candidatus Dormibacteraeota bacterium]|nr:P-loop NTPase [Candidatus Dormibacteraeota bacterium]